MKDDVFCVSYISAARKETAFLRTSKYTFDENLLLIYLFIYYAQSSSSAYYPFVRGERRKPLRCSNKQIVFRVGLCIILLQTTEIESF